MLASEHPDARACPDALLRLLACCAYPRASCPAPTAAATLAGLLRPERAATAPTCVLRASRLLLLLGLRVLLLRLHGQRRVN